MHDRTETRSADPSPSPSSGLAARFSLLLIAVIGLSISVGSFFLVERQERDRLEHQFQRVAADRLVSLEKRIQRELDLLRSVQAFYASSKVVDRDEFRRFVSGFLERFDSSIQAIEWIPRIPHAQRQGYRQAARADGFEAFRIHELDADRNPRPAADRETYFPVYYLEPYAGNERSLGFDLATIPAYAEALTKARDSNTLVATAPVSIYAEADDRREVLIFAPIYRQGESVVSMAQRRRHLLGFGLIVVRLADLLADQLASPATTDFDIHVYDKHVSPKGQRLHSLTSPRRGNRPVDDLTLEECCSGPHVAQEFAVGGRHWMLVARPVDPEYGVAASWQPWVSLLVGIAFTGLLLLYLRSHFHRAEATRALVARRTAELSEQSERFDIAVNGSGAGLWDWDVHSDRVFYSERFRELLGFHGEEEFPGVYESWVNCLHEDDRVATLDAMEQHLSRHTVFDVASRLRTAAGDYRWFRMTGKALWDEQGESRRMAGSLVDIEDTKVLEEELRGSEQRTREIIDSMVDGIITIDDHGEIQTVNPAAVRIFGYQTEELIGKNVKVLMPEPYHSEHDGYLSHYMHGGEARIIGIGREVRGRRKDGSVFPMELGVNEGWHGGQRMFTGIVRDITERVTAAQALSRFKTTLDVTEDCVFMFDPVSLRFFYVNRGAQEQVGYSEQELLEMTPVDIKPLMDESGFRTMLQPLIDGPKSAMTFETVHRHRDGHDVPVEIALQYVAIAEQEPRFVAIVRDITERKKAERELREYGDRLALATESGGIGVWEYDVATDSLDWDQRMFQIYGVERTRFPRAYEAWQRGMHPDDRTRLNAELGSAIAGDRAFDTEFRVIWPDGEVRNIKARALVVRDQQERALRVVGINWDITESKRIDRMKNEFVSTVSHELRTPLTSIMGSLSLLRTGAIGELPEKVAHMIDIAHTNSERLVRLINDILDVEKIESGKLEFRLATLDLCALVAKAIEANEGYAREHDIHFEFSRPDDSAWVVGDEDRLIQVVTNLLSNAAKFSPPGQSVEVSVNLTDSGVRVDVRDHGPGIPEAFRGRIFQKFSQADASDTRQKGGTGLGLSISKAIVERHYGQIGFDSDAGKGATFWFELNAVEAEIPQPVEKNSRRGWGRILVVEDEQTVGVLIGMILDRDGYTVDIAHTAAEAKQKLSEHSYRVMTLDLKLPDQDGLSFYRELRETPKTRHLPIIVVSGFADARRDELNGDALYVVDWLSKPIDSERLLAAVLQSPPLHHGSEVKILHVEDDQDLARVVAEVLGPHGDVSLAPDLASARKLLAERRFDLVILDLILPDGSGEELLSEFNELDGATPPVIVFSAKEVSATLSENISAALQKSRASNEDLLAMVHSVVGDSEYQEQQKGT